MSRTTYTLPIEKVQLQALLLIVPLGLILGLPFVLFFGFQSVNFMFFTELPIGETFLLILLFLLGIPIHELLHGFGWVYFTQNKWKSIRFGVKWEYFTPYCHCKEPLSKKAFFIGAFLPLLVLGLIPAILSWINGNFTLWFGGFFFSIAAGGDIIAMWMLRKVKSNQKVLDHPEEMGFIVIDTEELIEKEKQKPKLI